MGACAPAIFRRGSSMLCMRPALAPTWALGQCRQAVLAVSSQQGVAQAFPAVRALRADAPERLCHLLLHSHVLVLYALH